MSSTFLRPAFLMLSLGAHAALYMSVGGAVVGQEADDAALKQPTEMRVTLLSESTPVLAEIHKPIDAGDGSTSHSPSETSMLQPDVLADKSTELVGEKNGGGTTSILPILPPAEPRYFPLGELTQLPQIEKDIPPGKMMTFPQAAPRTVIMHLLINEQGDIDKIEFEDASSLPASVGQALEESFSKLKFQPGRQGELAVKTRMDIEVSLDEILHIGQN